MMPMMIVIATVITTVVLMAAIIIILKMAAMVMEIPQEPHETSTSTSDRRAELPMCIAFMKYSGTPTQAAGTNW